MVVAIVVGGIVADLVSSKLGDKLGLDSFEED